MGKVADPLMIHGLLGLSAPPMAAPARPRWAGGLPVPPRVIAPRPLRLGRQIATIAILATGHLTVLVPLTGTARVRVVASGRLTFHDEVEDLLLLGLPVDTDPGTEAEDLWLLFRERGHRY